MNTHLQTQFDKLHTAVTEAILKLTEIRARLDQKNLSPEAHSEALELLHSRYARLTDLYTYPVLDLLFRVLQEPHLPFVDRCHRLKKLGLIDYAKTLYDIKEIRTTMLTEYVNLDFSKMQLDILKVTPTLLQVSEHTLRYIQQMLTDLK